MKRRLKEAALNDPFWPLKEPEAMGTSLELDEGIGWALAAAIGL